MRISRGGRIVAAWATAGCVASRFCGTARAGMPRVLLEDVPRYFSLTDMTRGRLEAISFFLLVGLLSAVAVRAGWNSLRKDFPRLPHLSLARSVGLICLWGLLFVLVLTMISGARELMTPGAWQQKGSTYQLRESSEKIAAEGVSP